MGDFFYSNGSQKPQGVCPKCGSHRDTAVIHDYGVTYTVWECDACGAEWEEFTTTWEVPNSTIKGIIA